MKKFFGVFFALVVVAFSIFQPYSLNFSKVFAQVNNASKETVQKKEECQPCKKPQNLATNETNKFSDPQILDKIKNQLKDLKKNKLSIYSHSDFQWSEAVKVDYKESKTSAVVVPSKDNPKSNVKKEYLVLGYNQSENKLADPTFMELQTPNNGDNIDLTIKTLDGEKVGTLNLNSKNGKTEEMKK